MSGITPVTHTEKVVAGQVEPITHFEQVIAEYGGGGGGGFTPTDEQLAAMNSGITAAKLTEDETNIGNSKTITDRIIMDDTETQDYYMQDSTPSNPSAGDYWFTDEPIVSADVSAMTGYAKAQTAFDIAATDTLNEAMGKLEKKADDNTTGISKLIYERINVVLEGTGAIGWTRSGEGMYYSDEISLTSIKTILGWCVVTFTALKSSNTMLVAQNDSGMGKFRLLANTGTYSSNASIDIRIYGTTDTV